MAINIKKLFKKEIPLDRGNMWETKTILDAKESSIKSFIKSFDSPVIYKQYNYWELLNFQADYFTNLLPVTFNDSEIDAKIYILFRCNFLFGNVGLFKKDDQIIPVVETTADIHIDGSIKKIVAYSAYEVMGNQGNLDQKLYNKKIIITKNDLKNYARLVVPSYQFGAIVRWQKFIEQQESLLKKIYSYSYLFTRKIMYNVNDVDAANVELKRFFSDDHPFLVNMDTLSPNSNKFTTSGLEGTNAADDIFYYYEKWQSIYYQLLGRRFNADKKGERNVTSEIESTQDNFDILENEQKVHKINFLNKCVQILSKTWEYVEQVDQKNLDQDQQSGKKDKTNFRKSNSKSKEIGVS